MQHHVDSHELSHLNQLRHKRPFLGCLTLRITGSKKQSDERVALLAVRVHMFVRLFFNSTYTSLVKIAGLH